MLEFAAKSVCCAANQERNSPMNSLRRHDVEQEGVITEREAFSLRSTSADPQGVAQSSIQSRKSLYILS